MVKICTTFSVNNAKKINKYIIICDHASFNIPKKYNNLGLSISDLKKHIGWDIGALKVAKKISKKLNNTLIHSGYSRLLIDCNRSLKAKGTFLKKSENIIIPGNKNILLKEKKIRSIKYYFPYHKEIEKFINQSLKKKVIPIVISIHSFTPIFFGKKRKWHIGILQGKDTRLSSIFIKDLKKYKNIITGINQPYKLDFGGDFTIPFLSAKYGTPHILIEIRQDLLNENKSINYWSNLISKILIRNSSKESLSYCVKPSNRIKNYYGERNNL